MVETILKPLFRATPKPNAKDRRATFDAKRRNDDDAPISRKECVATLRKGLEILEATGRKHGWLE